MVRYGHSDETRERQERLDATQKAPNASRRIFPSRRAGCFTSVAASNWEMVVTTLNGKTMITARRPETRASEADYPADAEFFGIVFKLGAFMPHLPTKTLRDRQDATVDDWPAVAEPCPR